MCFFTLDTICTYMYSVSPVLAPPLCHTTPRVPSVTERRSQNWFNVLFTGVCLLFCDFFDYLLLFWCYGTQLKITLTIKHDCHLPAYCATHPSLQTKNKSKHQNENDACRFCHCIPKQETENSISIESIIIQTNKALYIVTKKSIP